MEKVKVRVIGKAFRRTAPGGVVSLSRRDARILTALGRAEYVGNDAGRSTYAYATDRRPQAEAEADVEFTPSDKLDVSPGAARPKRRRRALATPEAPLENVAHTEKPKRRKAASRTRRKKGE